jgi:hypothetical protein
LRRAAIYSSILGTGIFNETQHNFRHNAARLRKRGNCVLHLDRLGAYCAANAQFPFCIASGPALLLRMTGKNCAFEPSCPAAHDGSSRSGFPAQRERSFRQIAITPNFADALPKSLIFGRNREIPAVWRGIEWGSDSRPSRCVTSAEHWRRCWPVRESPATAASTSNLMAWAVCQRRFDRRVDPPV